MLVITRDGHVVHPRIKLKIFPNIERGRMERVNGIIVHQTGGATADGAFGSYSQLQANGAHFLIDKDGAIYQTASLFKVANHVGTLKSRCIQTHRCSGAEFKPASAIRGARNLSKHELKKSFPFRFPSNADSVGIEIVGRPVQGAGENASYEAVNAQQNSSLTWLVAELAITLGVPMSEVYRHPEVSYKVKTEAATAQWQTNP